MLAELNITNFAIIDRLRLGLGRGFNALTGETGAGKSIIIDAVGTLLGQKVGPEFIRSGTQQAHVEGLFDLGDVSPDHAIYTLLAEHDLADADQPGQVILSRDINNSGRSVARINGRAVNLAILQEVGQQLIDIHGQNEHASLLRVGEHIEMLDQYADLLPLREQLAALVATLRQVRGELARLRRDERELARTADRLSYQVEEIEKADLQPGEDEQLAQERQILNNAERLTELADAAYRILYEGESSAEVDFDAPRRASAAKGRAVAASESRAVVDALNEVSGIFSELARYDTRMAEQQVNIVALAEQISDVTRALRQYRDSIEHDPARLEYVDERISLIHELKRKYGNTIEEINEFGARAAAELESITNSEERIAALQAQEDGLLQQISALAAQLSRARRAAGDRLARAVERAMTDLGMARIQMHVAITHQSDQHGILLPADVLAESEAGSEAQIRYAFDSRGADRVEFLLSSNPGEPLKPLARIASGGETSRLMLAIKSILSAADSTPTLIFDEVDVGVGGRSGQVVGEKLWGLSAQHQVICISHLPQIAAFGDCHFKISKQVEGGRTSTYIEPLQGEARVHEIAAMLGGPNPTAVSLENARQIIHQAAQVKQEVRAMVVGD